MQIYILRFSYHRLIALERARDANSSSFNTCTIVELDGFLNTTLTLKVNKLGSNMMLHVCEFIVEVIITLIFQIINQPCTTDSEYE